MAGFTWIQMHDSVTWPRLSMNLEGSYHKITKKNQNPVLIGTPKASILSQKPTLTSIAGSITNIG
jgi:hypothetical protein